MAKEEELLETLSTLRNLAQIEWQELIEELIKYYKCHQCPEPSCCTIACQLTKSEFINLAIASNMGLKEFYKEYCQTSPLGVYLKTPCPFLEKWGKHSRCKVHYIRPSLCRTYPFSNFPGLLLNIDICPMAYDIAKDLSRIVLEIKAEGKRFEPTELEVMTKRVTELLEVEETSEKQRIEGFFSKLDELAPPSGIGGRHDNAFVSLHVYRTLLDEFRKKGRGSSTRPPHNEKEEI